MEPYYRQKTGAETSDAAELARTAVLAELEVHLVSPSHFW
jgi:hypothetical protein